jgi:hypothetical protein
MKRLSILAAAAAAFALSLIQPAASQDLASQIVGVWKLKSFDSVEVETGKSTKLYGDAPIGIYIFSKGGHFSVILGNADRKKAATGVPTDEDRIRLHKTMAANTGTYKIEGNKISFTYTFAWNADWTGTTRVQDASIVGNVMTQKSPVFVSTVTGKQTQFTTISERAE